jgi:hypothetical protein
MITSPERNIHKRRLLSALTVVLALCVPALSTPDAQAPQPAAVPVLQDLHHVDELKEMFNRDNGHVRLVLLLSPT